MEKNFFFKKDNSVGYENLTSACFSISSKTFFTGTGVRSNSIFTFGINVTGISAGRTFVDIEYHGITLLNRLLFLTNFLSGLLKHFTIGLNSLNYATILLLSDTRYRFICLI